MVACSGSGGSGGRSVINFSRIETSDIGPSVLVMTFSQGTKMSNLGTFMRHRPLLPDREPRWLDAYAPANQPTVHQRQCAAYRTPTPAPKDSSLPGDS